MELQTLKADLHQTQVIATSVPEISDGEICLKVDRFAFTSNNITYGVAGDMLGYWQFFPPHQSESNRWGLLPVWGFAEVIESKVDGIPVGDRIFGYLPPATHLKMTPVNVTGASFFEGAAQRAKLPAGYNRYARVVGEVGYNPVMDDLRMLLFPLHITSFCLHELLSSKDWYGAEQILIVSASSKTSLGLAFALHEDQRSSEVVGLTSASNLEFVKDVGYYGDTIAYDAVRQIKDVPTAIVDMSGNSEVIQQLRAHLENNMMHCVNVGFTHWQELGAAAGAAQDPKITTFFAPSHIQKCIADWGMEEFQRRSNAVIGQSVLDSQRWLEIKKVDGIEALSDLYTDVCKGEVPANQGIIVDV